MADRGRRAGAFFVLLALAAGACGRGDDADAEGDAATAGAANGGALSSPADAFFANLSALCGRAFAGEATLSTSDAFAAGLVMDVRSCSEDEILIPVHTGEDRSRTWVLTRTGSGLRLKHDHRHEDGTEDPVTQYGGNTSGPGTATQQGFPADAFTAELLPEAATNVWTITIAPGERLTYHLTRYGEARATFEFDLTTTVPAPPPPWGGPASP